MRSLGMGVFAAFPILIISLALLCLGVYCIILFIKLAHRGIKALDIYIREHGDINNNL